MLQAGGGQATNLLLSPLPDSDCLPISASTHEGAHTFAGTLLMSYELSSQGSSCAPDKGWLLLLASVPEASHQVRYTVDS